MYAGLRYERNRIGKRLIGVGRSLGSTGDQTVNIPDSYEMPRNSFDLGFSYTLKSLTFKVGCKDILGEAVLAQCQPLPLFKGYLKFGYFPFYSNNKENYYTLIEQVVNYVVEMELPQVLKVEAAMTRKIKALMGIISSSLPYEVDATKLSGVIGVHRTTVVNYLYMLNKAGMINMLFEESKTVKKLQKPDKLYIENPNMLYAIASGTVDVGIVRETFCVNQLSFGHEVETASRRVTS